MKNKGLIYAVDDESDIIELLQHHLEKAGYEFKGFYDALSFLHHLREKKPDLIILDLMLPDYDGIELCKELKKEENYKNIPVIMLTARTKLEDKILGFEIGADDYVTKPFSPRELVARVNAVLRRYREKQEEKNILEAGKILKMDIDKFEVYVYDKKVDLRPAEFKILKLLLEKRGVLLKREQILEHISKRGKFVYERTVDVHIRNLRKKLGEAGKFIKNIKGMGYKFEE
ncbi:MAG: response regulator transcription factor [candidate division WOR-3 bacterium]